MRTGLLWLVVIAAGCSKSGVRFEGDSAGECSDGADNDQNGLFDCDDPNCSNSPDCDPTPGPGTGAATGGGTGGGTGNPTTTTIGAPATLARLTPS